MSNEETNPHEDIDPFLINIQFKHVEYFTGYDLIDRMNTFQSPDKYTRHLEALRATDEKAYQSVAEALYNFNNKTIRKCIWGKNTPLQTHYEERLYHTNEHEIGIINEEIVGLRPIIYDVSKNQDESYAMIVAHAVYSNSKDVLRVIENNIQTGFKEESLDIADFLTLTANELVEQEKLLFSPEPIVNFWQYVLDENENDLENNIKNLLD